MKLIVAFEWQSEDEQHKESLNINLSKGKFNLGRFAEILDIVEVQKNYVLLNIKDGVGMDLKPFKQYVFQYCPVTIETELDGEYSSLKLELV